MNIDGGMLSWDGAGRPMVTENGASAFVLPPATGREETGTRQQDEPSAIGGMASAWSPTDSSFRA
ncbi:hypothetical protein SMICM17S_06758 [Streptomyces microflavus]